MNTPMRAGLACMFLVPALWFAGTGAPPPTTAAGMPPAAGKPAGKADTQTFERIKSYKNSVRQLAEDDAEKLLAALKQLLPKRNYQGFRPWYLLSGGTEERPHYLLCEVNDIGEHPGSTPIRLTEFDGSGKVVAESTFDTGWRCYLTGGVNLASLRGAGDVVILGTDNWPGPGGYIQGRQYYAKVGERFDLIRVEDTDGEAVRNRYYVNHFRHGPLPPAQTAPQWEADLLSADRMKVLRALVWLGGSHRSPKPKSHPQDESREDVELVRDVRSRPKVIAGLNKLAQGSDRWVREQAQLALNPEDQR